MPFQAVKYRSKLLAIATHNHLKLDTELNNFLFSYWDKPFETDLFEQFRAGHYSAKAIYNLPFTVAEGKGTSAKLEDYLRDRVKQFLNSKEVILLPSI